MGKLIDFFSRKPMTSENFEALVSAHGRYIGNLPKQRAVQLRGMMEELNRRRALIDGMITQWQDFYDGYAELMADALTFLQVDPEIIDREKDEFYIDESNHCWIVRKEAE